MPCDAPSSSALLFPASPALPQAASNAALQQRSSAPTQTRPRGLRVSPAHESRSDRPNPAFWCGERANRAGRGGRKRLCRDGPKRREDAKGRAMTSTALTGDPQIRGDVRPTFFATIDWESTLEKAREMRKRPGARRRGWSEVLTSQESAPVIGLVDIERRCLAAADSSGPSAPLSGRLQLPLPPAGRTTVGKGGHGPERPRLCRILRPSYSVPPDTGLIVRTGNRTREMVSCGFQVEDRSRARGPQGSRTGLQRTLILPVRERRARGAGQPHDRDRPPLSCIPGSWRWHQERSAEREGHPTVRARANCCSAELCGPLANNQTGLLF